MRGRTARPVLAGGLGAAAGVVLVLPPMQAGGGVFAAVAVSATIVAAWRLGLREIASSASTGAEPTGSGETGSEPARRRERWGRLAGAGFALSLAMGAQLAAGLTDRTGLLGLPRSLWGLLLGVWLVPLILTSIGFAVSFSPPDPKDLERLRPDGRRDP